MPVNYDYLEKIGKRVNLPRNTWVRVPQSRWKPPKAPANLVISPYFHVKYTLLSGTKDGRVLVRAMRESPNDSTMWFQIPLLRGFTFAPDSRSFTKRWGKEDLGRYVHLEVMAQGVASCSLEASCYTSYSQEW